MWSCCCFRYPGVLQWEQWIGVVTAHKGPHQPWYPRCPYQGHVSSEQCILGVTSGMCPTCPAWADITTCPARYIETLEHHSISFCTSLRRTTNNNESTEVSAIFWGRLNCHISESGSGHQACGHISEKWSKWSRRWWSLPSQSTSYRWIDGLQHKITEEKSPANVKHQCVSLSVLDCATQRCTSFKSHHRYNAVDLQPHLAE